jgi:hypothetical protein
VAATQPGGQVLPGKYVWYIGCPRGRVLDSYASSVRVYRGRGRPVLCAKRGLTVLLVGG